MTAGPGGRHAGGLPAICGEYLLFCALIRIFGYAKTLLSGEMRCGADLSAAANAIDLCCEQFESSWPPSVSQG